MRSIAETIPELREKLHASPRWVAAVKKEERAARRVAKARQILYNRQQDELKALSELADAEHDALNPERCKK